MKTILSILKSFVSIKGTVVLLGFLMVLIVLGTLEQVDTGTFSAQKTHFRSWFLYWIPSGTQLLIPYFPGGLLLALLLLVNLLLSHIFNFKRLSKRIGLMSIHIGFFLLIGGECLSGLLSVESQMTLREHDISNYSESKGSVELVLIDTSNKNYDEVYAYSQRQLMAHTILPVPDTELKLCIHKWIANGELRGTASSDSIQPLKVTQGVGVNTYVYEKPKSFKDGAINTPIVFVEVKVPNKRLGVWLISNAISQEQNFSYAGKTYSLALRHKRFYLPYSIRLNHFIREVYPGTQIPKSFSSKISLYDAKGVKERDTIIYMNNPLKIGNKSFYQASYGDNDMVSYLQVVDNPVRLLTYLACSLIVVGLLVHFIYSLSRFHKHKEDI